MTPMSPPPWLEILLGAGAQDYRSHNQWPDRPNRIPAVVIESLLAADGVSPDYLYLQAFPRQRYDNMSEATRAFFGRPSGLW